VRNEYRFRSIWRVPGTAEEVVAVLSDASGLPNWWPSVYLEARALTEGGPDGVGATVAFHTRGRLPYTLRWQATVTRVDESGFSLSAAGDLVGRGRWEFAQEGPEVVITYDWEVRAAKPLLRRLTWLLKPVFEANHRWAMARGEESLTSELLRRRAVADPQHPLTGDG
jgi:hypothetical protein